MDPQVMDDARLMLSDETWGLFEAVLRRRKSPAGAPPELSDRDFVEAILYIGRTGCPWRDLPRRFGQWDAVYQRFRRWEKAGHWHALFEQLPADLEEARILFVDSTVIRAHPHAAGAPGKKGGKRRRPWGAAAVGSGPN
jgi:transposase